MRLRIFLVLFSLSCFSIIKPMNFGFGPGELEDDEDAPGIVKKIKKHPFLSFIAFSAVAGTGFVGILAYKNPQEFQAALQGLKVLFNNFKDDWYGKPRQSELKQQQPEKKVNQSNNHIINNNIQPNIIVSDQTKNNLIPQNPPVLPANKQTNEDIIQPHQDTLAKILPDIDEKPININDVKQLIVDQSMVPVMAEKLKTARTISPQDSVADIELKLSDIPHLNETAKSINKKINSPLLKEESEKNMAMYNLFHNLKSTNDNNAEIIIKMVEHSKNMEKNTYNPKNNTEVIKRIDGTDCEITVTEISTWNTVKKYGSYTLGSIVLIGIGYMSKWYRG